MSETFWHMGKPPCGWSMLSRQAILVCQRRCAAFRPRMTHRKKRCREVVIQWTTRDVGQPIAMVSATPGGPYTATAAANTTTYLRSDMCGGIAATCAPRSPGLVSCPFSLPVC